MPTASILRRRLPVLTAAAMAVTMAFAGSASALPGSGSVDNTDLRANVVRSIHIKNGEVKNLDLALGSVIASTVADGSLTGTDIQDGSLTGDDVADGTIKSADVTDRSLTGDDVANDSLTGQQVKESTLQGVASDRTRTVSNDSAVMAASGGTGAVTTACAATERAIGATAAVIIPGSNSGTLLDVQVTYTMPSGGVGGSDIASYEAGARNQSVSPRILRLFVTCQAKTIG